jgi:hypothetical protein
MFGKDDLIDWCCPYCGTSLTRPGSFFLLGGPWFCPSCDAALDMTRVRELMMAYESDMRNGETSLIKSAFGLEGLIGLAGAIRGARASSMKLRGSVLI